MHKFLQFSFFIFFLLATFNINAESRFNASHSEIEIISHQSVPNEKNIILLGVKLSLQKNWHTYWLNPGDSGEPASFEWNLPRGFEISEPLWPIPEKIPYPPLMTYGYNDQVIIPFKLKVPKNYQKPYLVKLNSEWLVCADVCIPQSGNVSLNIEDNISKNNTENKNLIKIIDNLPIEYKKNINATIEENNLLISLEIKKLNPENNIYFFPFSNELVDIKAKQVFEITENNLNLKIPLISKYNVEGPLKGLLKISGNDTKTFSIEVDLQEKLIPKKETAKFISLGFALLFSVLGGLILNLMPCVFPVISLKILNFIKNSDNPVQTTLHGLSFSTGAIVTFVLIGISILVLQAMNINIGWGYQLQSPLIVALLIYLFIFLAGFFLLDLNIGSSLTKANNLISGTSGYFNSFATGFLAVIVATPCTAPFMGSALGFAILQPGYYSFLIFLFLGIGFSLPYLILSAFPKLVSILPKPGKWMEIFKQVMAFPMILTAIWLMWVLSSQVSQFQLSLVLIGITIIIFIYWLNTLPFTSFKSVRIKKTISIFLIFSLIIFLPINTDSKEANTSSVFSKELLGLKIKESPVFLNFTADWCITCKVNERVALNSSKIKNFFLDNNIEYIEADWTNKNDEISQLLASYGRSSIPFYVYFKSPDSEPIILPEILTEEIIISYLKN